MTGRIEKEDLLRIAEAVAPLLPGKWTVKNDPEVRHRVDITESGGRSLSVSGGGSGYGAAGKLHISASLPGKLYEYKPYNASLPSINVAPDKSAEVIARDIARRVLPDYQPIYLAAVESLANWTRHNALQDALVERMALVFSTGINPSRGGGDRRSSPKHDPTLYVRDRGDIMVSGQTVTLQLRVTPEEAEAIAKLLTRAK